MRSILMLMIAGSLVANSKVLSAEEMLTDGDDELEGVISESVSVVEELERHLIDAKSELERFQARRTTDDPGKIVNGVRTTRFPATGAVLRGSNAASASSWCTGTLIGCQTFLTAAHCVEQNEDPSNYKVFMQHVGFVDIEAVTWNKSEYNFPDGDVAVLTLAEPISGVSPVALNDVGEVPFGTEGVIVGFGRTGGRSDDYGVKRRGRVVTAKCEDGYSNDTLICWNYDAPIGVPGENSNTCNGDSGGSLFVQLGDRVVLAGVTSGGTRSTCLTGDHSYDADVHKFLDWIRAWGGEDVQATECGPGPQVGSASVVVLSAGGVLSRTDSTFRREFEVPRVSSELRVTLNAVDNATNNFDIYLRWGSAPSPSEFDCAQTGSGQYGACKIDHPRVGTWNVLINRVAGEGEFQVTATIFQ